MKLYNQSIFKFINHSDSVLKIIFAIQKNQFILKVKINYMIDLQNLDKVQKIYQQVQMNEGKSKLQAMRRKFQKKVNNNQTPLQTNSNGTQQNGHTQLEISHQKIPIEQRFQKVQKNVQTSENVPKQKNSFNQKQKSEEKLNPTPLNIMDTKKSQQALQQGEIQEQQKKQEIPPLENAKPQKIEIKGPQTQQKIFVQNKQMQKKPEKNIAYYNEQNQKGKTIQPVSNMEIQEGQIQNNENEQKVIDNLQEKTQKIIQEPKQNPKQDLVSDLPNDVNLIQQKAQKQVNRENAIEMEQKLQQNQQNISAINNNKVQQHSVDQPQQQVLNKIPSNDSLQATQSLNLQPSQSLHNNSVHMHQRKNYNHQPSNKPAIKVVLKQLQMIKSTIHNLNVTYRGVEYLRQKIKQDPVLKRKIKQRLIDLQGDDQMDVLRKLVKKVQQQCSRNTQNQKQVQTKTHSAALIEPSLTNQQSISDKIVSQPQVLISNDAIDY